MLSVDPTLAHRWQNFVLVCQSQITDGCWANVGISGWPDVILAGGRNVVSTSAHRWNDPTLARRHQTSGGPTSGHREILPTLSQRLLLPLMGQRCIHRPKCRQMCAIWGGLSLCKSVLLLVWQQEMIEWRPLQATHYSVLLTMTLPIVPCTRRH